MRKSTGDLHFDERMNESRGPGEVHHAVVAGAARELGRILPGGAFDEHALDRADHALADRARLRLQMEEHTSELQSQSNLVCRLLLEKKKQNKIMTETVISPVVKYT